MIALLSSISGESLLRQSHGYSVSAFVAGNLADGVRSKLWERGSTHEEYETNARISLSAPLMLVSLVQREDLGG